MNEIPARFVAIVLLLIALVAPPTRAQGVDLTMWYRQPAQKWEEALPLGNGRLGAMVFGGVQRERIGLSEGTLWLGKPGARPFDPRERVHLERQRALTLAGKYAEARALKVEELPPVEGQPTSQPVQPAGTLPPTYPTAMKLAFQPLGDLWLHFPATEQVESDYRRSLNLDTAIATTTFRVGNATFTREAFCSYADQALVLRVTCDQPGRVTFNATMTRERDVRAHVDRYVTGSEMAMVESMTPPPMPVIESTAAGSFTFRGECEPGGIAYATHVRAIHDGGEVLSKGDGIAVRGANAVTLVVVAATSYHGADETATCTERLAAAAAKSYDTLRAAHIADHQKLFRRVGLDLGTNDATKLPLDRRLLAVQQDVKDPRSIKPERDPHLIALYFQFGRYLMIAGSRLGSLLPMNLQGIWNDSIVPPWFGGFVSDINQEMIYWPAELTNLSECHEPQFDFLEFLAPSARTAARLGYGARGLVIHGMTPFGTKNYTSDWPDAAGWLSLDFWERYQFTLDKQFLARRGYPFMRDSALFYCDWLIEHPTKKWLVVAPGYSPENPFRAPDGTPQTLSDGATVSIAVVRELFVNTIKASDILGVDPEIRAELSEKLKRLAPLQVGRYGQLQEWVQDFEEHDPGHRHHSHLFPLYPGTWVNPRGDDQRFFKAAGVAVRRRMQHGSGWTGWSRAWLLNLSARLEDGELAHENVQQLLRKCTFPNLFDTHPRRGGDIAVFQIEGNFGGTAGIAEMLVQSHLDEINLLPALPKEWPKGHVAGLRARGGYEVDVAWNAGKLTSATIRASVGGMCRVRYGELTGETQLPAGASATCKVVDTGLTFERK
jgi:alpha-L-fucosidase 2